MLAKIILASASPRRKELLAAAGFEFDVTPSTVEERQGEQESAETFVCRVAREKAQDVLAHLPANVPHTVLGADTVVLLDGRTFGKPASADDAAAMLRSLSGKRHLVLTGVCLLHWPESTSRDSGEPTEITRTAATTVTFSALNEREIQEYIASGEPFDKAGAYAIQGRASKFVESIEGCYFNVVGLPISLVYRMMKDLYSSMER
jgi:nucleoside triphosphate pyrophosphatase